MSYKVVVTVTKEENVLLGKRMNAVRKEKRISSNELSEQCEIDPVYVRMIERGVRTPSLSVFIKICNSLRVSPGYLLAGSLESENEGQYGAIFERMKELTPKQTDMVTAMIETMLEKLEQ